MLHSVCLHPNFLHYSFPSWDNKVPLSYLIPNTKNTETDKKRSKKVMISLWCFLRKNTVDLNLLYYYFIIHLARRLPPNPSISSICPGLLFVFSLFVIDNEQKHGPNASTFPQGQYHTFPPGKEAGNEASGGQWRSRQNALKILSDIWQREIQLV